MTGATSGIGRAVAMDLATRGVTVGIVARDPARGEQTRTAIAAGTQDAQATLFVGDLSDLSSVRRLAASVAAAWPTLDVLVHCAAVYTRRRSITADGFETMFATNVLGPFLLTNLLLAQLRRAEAARILVLTAPSTVKLDFEDLQSQRRFRSLTAFGASKAADLVLVHELARRLGAGHPIVNAVHPGLARTNLMRGAPAPLRWATRLASAPPERAAASIATLALASEYGAATGRFYKAGKAIDPPPYTLDPTVGRQLWAACAVLTGLSGPTQASVTEAIVDSR